MTAPAPDDAVTVATAPTEFAAETLAVVLRAEGIEAHVFGTATTGLGFSLPNGQLEAAVQVARRDADRARALLAATRANADSVDWDSVDVGDRDDDVPLRTPGRMPPLARIAFAVAVLIVLVTIAGWIMSVLA